MSEPLSDRVCLDASVALAFFLEDEPFHEQAKQLIRQWAAQNVTLCAPAMFAYECDSIIRLRVYKKGLTAQKAEEARAFLDALGITIEYDASDRIRAYQIAPTMTSRAPMMPLTPPMPKRAAWTW